MLRRAGIAVERVAKVSEDPDNVAGMVRDGRVDLVINTPFGRGPRSDGYYIRTAAVAAGVPPITTLPGAFAAVHGIEALRSPPTEPRSVQEYHAEAMAGPMQARLTFATDGGARREGVGVKRVRAEILSTRKVGAYHSPRWWHPRSPRRSARGSSSR